jgi:glycosyltransferase involved in cell wall biosynthesis
VVLGVFRLSAEKRPLLVVEVCAALAQRRPDVRFLLVGIGPMLEDVRNAAHKSGIADRLAILGRRDDVAALMALSDVLLLTSAFEGMPNAVMEAQVLGLPGGVRDCLDDGRSGFLVEGASATAYVDAVECVLDPARLVTFRAAARQRAADRFSHARMAEAYLRLAGFGIVAAPPDRAALLHAG